MKHVPLHPRESERLRVLRSLDILDTDQEQAYDDLARLAACVCDAPVALISLIDEQRQWFKSECGMAVEETPRDWAFCAHAILGQQLLVVEDASRDGRFRDNPFVTGAPYVRFYAGAPLVMEEGLAVGTLCVVGYESRSLSPEQADALQVLARQVVQQLELRRRLGQLHRLDRAKDEFIAMVSHEMQTPLTSVCGSLSLLRHGKAGRLDQDASQMVDLAHRNAERLRDIVQDILELTKLEAGGLQVERQVLDLQALVSRALELNRRQFDRGAHAVLQDGIDSEVWIHGDEQCLLQVLGRLISNAAKFASDGDRVEVRLRTAEQTARIEITDHGPGISASDQTLLFGKFQQIGSGEHRKLPGTGLGLHICKRIVELHRGELGVESYPNERTTFHISLPLANTHAPS